MRKYMSLLLSLLLIMVSLPHTQLSVYAQENYSLEYKFQLHDCLKYKTDKLDSITSSMPDRQEMTRQINSYTIKTMTIDNISPDTPFTVSITTDSTWSDSENNSDPGRGSQPGGQRVRLSMRDQDLKLSFNKQGKSTTDEPVVTPLIIPLAERPVSINDQWNFNLTSERKGRYSEKTTITGKCFLYDVQQTENNNTAVIIINTERSGEGKFHIKTPQGEISGINKSSGTISALVYFDIDRGRINEIVSVEKTETVTGGSAFSSKMLRTSKSTTKLINQ